MSSVKVTTSFPGKDRFRAAAIGAVHAGLTRAAITAEGHMKRGMSKVGRYHASSPGNAPNVRTGALRNSITHTESAGAQFKSAAGSNLPYAKIMETGGTIRPRRTKFIPVPLNIPAMRLSELHGGITTYFEGVSGTGWLASRGLKGLDLHIERTKGGALILVGKRVKKVRWSVGRGGWLGENAVPRWILKRSVKMPARPWAWPAVQKNKQDIVYQAAQWAAKVFASAGFKGRAS